MCEDDGFNAVVLANAGTPFFGEQRLLRRSAIVCERDIQRSSDADAIALLCATGLTHHTELVFPEACLFDLAIGIASCADARSNFWWSQLIRVAGYTVVIGVFSPEFLFQPFGPITKNIAVVACLAFLALADRGMPVLQAQHGFPPARE